VVRDVVTGAAKYDELRTNPLKINNLSTQQTMVCMLCREIANYEDSPLPSDLHVSPVRCQNHLSVAIAAYPH